MLPWRLYLSEVRPDGSAFSNGNAAQRPQYKERGLRGHRRGLEPLRCVGRPLGTGPPFLSTRGHTLSGL
jgi:hypothetical protein